jgi:hypothetical protein
VEAMEGDGPMSVMVNITSDRPLRSPGSLWLHTGIRGIRIDIAAGASGVVAQANVSWIGDDVYSPISQPYTIFYLQAMAGVLTGFYGGGVNVIEDDPQATLVAPISHVTASEGQLLVWNLALTAPAVTFDLLCTFSPVPNRTELSSADVPSKWLPSDPPQPPAPLSSLGLTVVVRFNYGQLATALKLPTVADGTIEGERAVALSCSDLKGKIANKLSLTGTVVADQH